MGRIPNISGHNLLGCLLAAAVAVLLFLVVPLLLAVVYSDQLESWAGELVEVFRELEGVAVLVLDSGPRMGVAVFGLAGVALLVGVPVAGIGVCLGVYWVSRSERKARHMERRRADIQAALITVLHLKRMWQEVRGYDGQVIDPVRDHPVRHVRMQPSAALGDDPELPWADLVFLMRTSPELLPRISNAQMVYRRWREIVAIRNRDHERRIQPELEELEGIVGSLDESATREALGEGLDQAMRTHTDLLIEHTTRLDQELAQTLARLRIAVMEIYPGVWIPRISLSE